MQCAAYFYPAPARAKRDGIAGYLNLEQLEPTGLRHRVATDIRCGSKREARQIAEAHGYKPWNF